jgi:hypothetical protein
MNTPSKPESQTRLLRLGAAIAVLLATQSAHTADGPTFTKITMGTAVPSWGCAWGDYNKDGYSDLFVAEGTATSTAACSLYRNNQDGTLVPVTPDEAGDIVRLARHWTDVAWGDFDNDGALDLFVADYALGAQSTLWRNLANGSFAAALTTADLPGTPLWGDYDRDGWLDLVAANPYYDSGDAEIHNELLFNRGDSTFNWVTNGDWGDYRTQRVEGASAGDMDNDGDLDILETGERTTLFENDGAGGFHQVTTGFPAISGMSITPSWADYDNDGRLDVFVAVYNQTNQLLHNDGNGQWTQIPLGEPLETSCGMWADYDNDGDLDLFITRGQGTTTSNLFFENNGDGTFTSIDVGDLTGDQGRSAGCAWADYDNNGSLDLFVTRHAGLQEVLYRNDGNGNRWISFKLVGTVSNRSAIGAKVRLQATIFGKTYWQMRELGGGNRHQNDLRAHFGLGDATAVQKVRIEWPSGVVQELQKVSAKQILEIKEPAQLVPLGPTEFQIRCWKGMPFEVQKSSNLKTWDSLGMVTNVTGTLSFQDTQTDPRTACCFYRVASR